MNILKIRILVDDQQNFIRELEIKSTQTFKDLHEFMVQSFNLDGQELASFHITDDNWRKLREITLINMLGEAGKSSGKDGKLESTPEMARTRLNEYLDEIDQKMLYEYDFLQMHTFRMEVIDILGGDSSNTYPRISYSNGKLQLKENVKVEEDPEKLKRQLLEDFKSLLGSDEDEHDYGEEDDY